ncbi:nephrin-like protein, partial [Dinothrombium tinctorium]
PPNSIKIIGPDKGKVGETLTFECIVGPSNPAAEVTWVIDGRPMLPIASWTKSVKEGWITTTNVSVTLNSLDPDTKSISCYAASETLRDTILQTVNLQILYPPGIPTIIGYKKGSVLREGDLQRLQCVSLGGNPFATLKWFRGLGTDREISGLTTVSGSGVSSELIIRVKASDNEATYRCEATNAATSEPLTVSIKLTVLFISSLVTIKTKPKFPKNGDTLTLTVDTGSCNPMCFVSCTKNGVLLTMHKDEVLKAENFGKNTKSSIEFIASPKEDNSMIVCESYNKELNKTAKQKHTIRIL